MSLFPCPAECGGQTTDPARECAHCQAVSAQWWVSGRLDAARSPYAAHRARYIATGDLAEREAMELYVEDEEPDVVLVYFGDPE